MLLDVSGNHYRLNSVELVEAAGFTPREKLAHGLGICGACVLFLFRMFAVKNSMKRQAAFSPARVIAAGKRSKPARPSFPEGMGASSKDILFRMKVKIGGGQRRSK